MAGEIGRDDRFIAYDNGTVMDAETGLMWAAGNNGKDINWQGARVYCENYRGGGYSDWRMPTQNELSAIYKLRDKKGSRVIEFIGIAKWFMWASETDGTKAAYFYSCYSLKGWAEQDGFIAFRALPVRRVR